MATQRLRILVNLSWQLLKLRFSKEQDKDSLSKRLLFEKFRYLGGVYIKFLQMLSLNIDFLKGWTSPVEFDVFEAVDTEDITIHALLQKELPDYQKHFTYVEPAPFAAGSFAQVYRAELLDGSPVIIKVLRPSLTKNLDFDLRMLSILTRIASWLYPTSIADVVQAYRQFASTTKAETNYKQEVSNTQWFYRYFENTPEIVIPKIYAELCTARIITQEFVGGLSVADVLKAQKTGREAADFVKQQLGSDIWVQMRTIGREFLKSTILADFVIGDPHPGNIKLLPNNKVGLIDFGIIAPAPKNRQAFLDLIYEYKKLYEEAFDAKTFTVAMLGYFDEDLVSALTTVGKILNPAAPIDFVDQIATAAAHNLDSKMHQASIQGLLRRKMMTRIFGLAINDKNRFGVRLNLQALNVFKAAHIYLSMSGNLGKNGEHLVFLAQAINDSLHEIEQQDIPMQQPKNSLSSDQAVELVSSWIAQIADSDPFLFQQLSGSLAA